MASSAIAWTGGTMITATALEPYTTWAIHGFPSPAPEGTGLFVATGVIVAGHALFNLLRNTKIGQKMGLIPAPPQPQGKLTNE